MITLFMQLEYELAETRGIDLRYVESIAPETARRWREDNKSVVHAMHAGVLNR